MSNYEIHLERAREFLDEGNYEAAQTAASYAISEASGGDCVDAKVIQALALRRLELNDEAMAILQGIVNSTPVPEACAEYALICAERGHCDVNCREMAFQAAQDNPDLPSAYMALFWCDAMDGQYQEALKNLRRGMHRGAEFSDARAFEMVRGWCQEFCNNDGVQAALELSTEVVDLFGTFDFLVLHARLAELCGDDRTAVSYYKRVLVQLRPGQLRTDILEAIARIAI